MTKKTKEDAELLLRAKNIAPKKVLEAMEGIAKLDRDVFRYLESVGLSESDVVAMAEKTLRGQQVARAMYAGMLDGLRQGLELLALQDRVAHEVFTKWLGEDDESTSP